MPHKHFFLVVRLLVFALLSSVTVIGLQAQTEICNNGIDDDFDGLIDQLDPDCGDADMDGVADALDRDQDNDGILDLTEIECTGVPYDMIVWSHNGTDAAAPTLFQPSLIGAFTNEDFGLGLNASHLSSIMKLSGVESNDLQAAIAADDFISYSLQPSNTAGAMKVTGVQIGRIAVSGVVAYQNYGYSLAVLYSNDGFASSEILCDPVYIDSAVTSSYERIDIPMNFDYLLLEPQYNYEFKVYVFAHDYSTSISLDDFRFQATECAVSLDQDNDGVKNWFDLDSDNDGIYDVVEGGTGYSSNDGRLIGGVDAYGIPLVVSSGVGTVTNSPYDLDGDGRFDFVDMDSDADGCFDVLEQGYPDQDFDGHVGDSLLVTDTLTGVILGTFAVYSALNDADGNGLVDYRETSVPGITCSADVQVTLPASASSISYAPDPPALLNSCGSYTLSYDNGHIGSDDFYLGTRVLQWELIDQEGNVLGCQQEVTTIDTEAPQAICKTDTFDLQGNQSYLLSASHVDDGSSDNCGIVHKEIQPAELLGPGSHQVKFIVIDASGNSDTCYTSIYLTDTLNIIRVSAKVFLEGAFEHSVGLMRDDLRTLGRIPLQEPYYELGFSSFGPGMEEIDPQVLSVQGSTAVVDWIFLELRDKNDPVVIIANRSALLLRDGRIVDTDGISPVGFIVPNDQYFLAIRHRNHLAVMTPAAIDFSVPLLVDLTADPSDTWGLKALKPIGGVQLMWAGNVSDDGKISYNGPGNDRDAILLELGGVTTAIEFAYSPADVNMDGMIRYAGVENDRDIILHNIGDYNATNVNVEQLP